MIHRVFPLSVALIIIAGCSTPRRADLRPKLKPGCEVHYLVTSRTERTQRIESAPGESPREIQSVYTHDVGMRLRCREVREDGSAVLDWSLPYVAISMKGRMPIEYDSRDPEQADSPLGLMFAQLINQPATVTVDTSGQVTDYVDPASIGGGPIRYFMASLLSRQAYRLLGLLVIGGAPSDAAVDATWSDVQPVDLPQGLGTMLVTSNYRLEGLTDRGTVAEIVAEGTLSMREPEPTDDENPAEQPRLIINVGEFARKTAWDCSAGQLISSESRSKLSGTAPSPAGTMAIEEATTTSIKRATPQEFGRAAEKPASPEPEDEPQPHAEAQPDDE